MWITTLAIHRISHAYKFSKKCLRKKLGNRAVAGSELSTHAYKGLVTVEPEISSSGGTRPHYCSSNWAPIDTKKTIFTSCFTSANMHPHLIL